LVDGVVGLEENNASNSQQGVTGVKFWPHFAENSMVGVVRTNSLAFIYFCPTSGRISLRVRHSGGRKRSSAGADNFIVDNLCFGDTLV
jgi:hypothetical protein